MNQAFVFCISASKQVRRDGFRHFSRFPFVESRCSLLLSLRSCYAHDEERSHSDGRPLGWQFLEQRLGVLQIGGGEALVNQL